MNASTLLGKLSVPWDSYSLTQSKSTSIIAGSIASFLLLLVTNKQFYLRVLFPGVAPDPKYKKTHSLPPGEITGWPFIGSLNIFPDMNKCLREQAHKVYSSLSSSSSPLTFFKTFLFGKPCAIIIGSSQSRKIMNQEFSPDGGGISQPFESFESILEIVGKESLTTEIKSKKKYKFLRKLVGQSMTHEAVADSMVALQEACESVIQDKIIKIAQEKGSVKMEQQLKYLTLDIAWRQILGLELKSEEEIEEFHRQVQIWIDASSSSMILLYAILPKLILKMTPPYKARVYLTTKLMDKIKILEKKGCSDRSTMGAMLFAEDEDDPTKKLSHQQVVDNALILIAAGSETSSNTLTTLILLLGMHPDVYQKLITEQQELIEAKGEQLTKHMLDNDCPYLEGVVKEVMRIFPIGGGPVRKANATLTIDNIQIPKNWWILPCPYLTHEYDPVTRLDDGSHMDLVKGFKPERWLDKETRPKEYMPWGVGYRFCAGHILAMAEMKTFVAIFSRKIKSFELVNPVDDVKDIKWEFRPIMIPKDKVPITIDTMQ